MLEDLFVGLQSSCFNLLLVMRILNTIIINRHNNKYMKQGQRVLLVPHLNSKTNHMLSFLQRSFSVSPSIREG